MKLRRAFQRPLTWLLAAGLAAGLRIADCGLRNKGPGSGYPQSPIRNPQLVPPFSDRAAAAGLRFSRTLPDRMLNILETSGSGCAFLDVDGDGWLDLLLLGENQCALYRNAGDGTFRDATAGSGLPQAGRWSGCAAGDYDNDGRVDLFLNGYGVARLLHNEGGGRFRDVTKAMGLATVTREPLWGSSAAWADYNRDGWLDLYVARYARFGPGSKQFCVSRAGRLETCNPRTYEAQVGSLYENVGGRRFVDRTQRAGLQRAHGKTWGVTFFDYDDDGWPDLYLANDEEPGDLFHNLGGRFENVAVQAGAAFDGDGRTHGAMGVDAGDYDGDGRLDLLVTTYFKEGVSLYHNNEGRSFSDLAGPAGLARPTLPNVGWGTRLFDYDNDGRLDALCVNGHVVTLEGERKTSRQQLEQPMFLFHNEGGHFTPVPLGPLAAPIVGRGAAFGDYDNDGFPDVLVLNMGGPAVLLHNDLETAANGGPTGASPSHWLGIRLVGRRSNRDGLGARVTVRAGGRSFAAQAQTCGSVFSANDPRLRFGLGSAAMAEEVVVRWPAGGEDRLQNVAADRYVEVREGQSAVGRR
jgi:hypothetical protein